MRVALIGNPNVGKSTLFTRLTKEKQEIGNYPGVTIEKKKGWMGEIEIEDLPGIYSLVPFTKEEEITCNELEREDIDLWVQVIDATTVERSFYLTLSLMQKKKDLLLVFTSADRMAKEGVTIDIFAIEEKLGISVFLISNQETKSIEKLKKAIIERKYRKKKEQKNFALLNVKMNREEEIKTRYRIIETHLLPFFKKEKRITKSDKIDQILLHPYFSLFFAFAFFLFFFFLIFLIGGNFTRFLMGKWDLFLVNLKSQLPLTFWVKELCVEGILRSVGTILCFLPELFFLFSFLALLEKSGYMARLIFILDGYLRPFSLSGRALIPFLMSMSCTVPALLSTRTIKEESERKSTLFLTSFFPCSAKLPLLLFFSTTIFKEKALGVLVSLYFLSFLFVFIGASFLQRKVFKSNSSFLFLELPSYQLPSALSIFLDAKNKCKDFIKKVFSLILVGSFILWFLSSFSFQLSYVSNIEDSMLAGIGKYFSFLFRFMVGESSWALFVSFLEGMLAKEQILSSIQMLTHGEYYLSSSLFSFLQNKDAGYAFLIFLQFSPPCIQSLITICKELRSRRSFFLYFFLQLSFAFLLSYLVFFIGRCIL